MYVEKEDELNSLAIRHAATEAYVDELRLRVAKLTERESATESYIRDLETKLKNIDETTESSNSSVVDLKREISQLQDAEAYSAQHIADLEARLAKSDENVLTLRSAVESLELQSESRRRQVEELERQLMNITKDSEGWRKELEAREQRVEELEERLKRWEEEKEQAADDRARLGDLVGTVSKARESLDIEVSRANDKEKSAPVQGTSELQAQYVALQETHTATLADLSAVSAKYRDALREISDLAAQIAEAKLQSATASGAEAVEEPTPPVYDSMSLGRRRGMVKRMDLSVFENSGVVNSTNGAVNGNGTGGRRLLFRQAASAESLHARSQSQSPSLSQELSSARTPKHSLTASNGMNGISISPGSTSSFSGPTTPKLSLLASSTISSAPQTPAEERGRSVQSLEKEIMRLQEVLNEREAEITALEGSIKELKKPKPAKKEGEEDVDAATNGGHPDGRLSPTLMKRFARLRHSLIIEHPPKFPDADTPEDSETLNRLDELMR
jgi:predicted  nucleic acid-binding Zn-ribbon protein